MLFYSDENILIIIEGLQAFIKFDLFIIYIMGQEDIFTLRVDFELHDKLKGLSKKYGMPICDFYNKGLLMFLKSLDDIKDFNIENAEQRYNIKIKRAKMRENKALLFIVRNFYKSLFQMAQSFLINSDCVNMDAINLMIDDVVALFKSYPLHLKEQLKGDIKNIETLRNEKVLMAKYNAFNFPLISRREELSFIKNKADEIKNKYGGVETE